MSFIAKNPLTIPETEHTPSTPPGTRGLFAKDDGWYEVDSNGEARRILTDKDTIASGATPLKSSVHILGGSQNWTSENVVDSSGNIIGYRYGQTVNVNNAVITPYSKVDLQVTSEQMAVFYEKSLAFVAENDNGVVTVYCVGSIPENDYTMQAIVTEVAVNE